MILVTQKIAIMRITVTSILLRNTSQTQEIFCHVCFFKYSCESLIIHKCFPFYELPSTSKRFVRFCYFTISTLILEYPSGRNPQIVHLFSQPSFSLVQTDGSIHYLRLSFIVFYQEKKDNGSGDVRSLTMYIPKHLICELVVLNGYPLIRSELFLATNGCICKIKFVH